MDYNVLAIVLTRMDVGERDVLTTLFSFEYGRMQAIVRGTKKTVSSLRPATQPLNEGQALIIGRRGTDLLTEWMPVSSFPDLKTDVRRLCLAGYYLRCVNELTSLFQPEPKFYVFLRNSLAALQKTNSYAIMRLVFEWGLLDISGLLFDLNTCIDCGEPASGAQRVALDIAQGGPVCARCINGAQSEHIVFFSLDAMKLGKNIKEILTRISGDVCLGEEQIASFIQHLHNLNHDNGTSGSHAVQQLQKAVTRFMQYHLNEFIPAWHVRV